MKTPFAVRFGLLGIKGRQQAIRLTWLCYALSLTTFFTAERTDVPRISLAIGLAVAATWALLSRRWMDRHDRWPSV